MSANLAERSAFDEATTPAAPPKTMTASRPGLRGRRVPWWFLLPAAALYLFIVIWPSIQGGAFAFTDWDGLSLERTFVGLINFQAILSDADSLGAIWHTLFLAVAITILQNLIGLLLALGVNTKVKSRNVLRVALFAPAVITPVATAFLFKYLLAPEGAVNELLRGVGLGGFAGSWLGDPDLVLWSIVGVVVWQFSGYSMVIFLAGLQGVPEEVLEASRVDGAGSWRRFWYVVRPELAPAITINVMLSVIGGLKLFDQVWVLTQGGPGTSSDTMSTSIYRSAFVFGDYGYAIAMSLILTAFVAALSAMQYWGLSKQGGNR